VQFVVKFSPAHQRTNQKLKVFLLLSKVFYLIQKSDLRKNRELRKCTQIKEKNQKCKTSRPYQQKSTPCEAHPNPKNLSPNLRAIRGEILPSTSAYKSGTQSIFIHPEIRPKKKPRITQMHAN
jgi:hypothetical protein